MTKLIKRGLLLTVSIIAFIFLAEFIIRKTYPRPTLSDAINYSADCFLPDEENVYKLHANFTCRMKSFNGDFDETAHINSLGYRGEEFIPEKNKDIKRILILGDSMTFGHGVGDNETYPYLIEKTLKKRNIGKVEVINAGFADGFSPDSYYLYLKNHGIKLSPDILIVSFFVWNDVSDLAENVWVNVDNQGLPLKIQMCCSVIKDGKWRNKYLDIKYRFPILRKSQFFLFLMEGLQKRFKLFLPPEEFTSGKSRRAILDPKDHSYDEEYKKVYNIFKAIKKITDENGIKFFVVLIPFDGQLYPENIWRYGYLKFPTEDRDYLQKTIAGYLKKADIEYLDLFPTFDSRKYMGKTSFPNDQHWNKLGHKIAAGAISKYLIERNFL